MQRKKRKVSDKIFRLLTNVLLICSLFFIFGCEKYNKKAEYFIIKARNYLYTAHGILMEAERNEERSYDHYRKVFKSDIKSLSDNDLLIMVNLGDDFEKDTKFKLTIKQEIQRRKTNRDKPADYYVKILDKARRSKYDADEGRRKSEYLDKRCFKFYKKAYAIDSRLFSYFDLVCFGRRYERYENNIKMRDKLWKKADYKED